MRICICGGGALGHVCAGFISSQIGNEVNLLTGHPEAWNRNIVVRDEEGKLYQGRLEKISNNPRDVVSDQDVILLCLPGFLIREALESIKPFIGNAVVGSVVSSTGFFFFAHDILGRNAKLFGFQRVPFIARVFEYGKSGKILGYKNELKAVVENISEEDAFIDKLSGIFNTPVIRLGNYLEVSLSNSNPILHTGRLYSLFYGKENLVFDRCIPFYREWTDDASELLIEMDIEFQQLLTKLGIQTIPSLLEYYESKDAVSLTQKISGIKAFQEIMSPMKQCDAGWVVDWSSRYFTEDFPYGLHIIRDICDSFGIPVPNISRVYNWGILNCQTNK